MFVPLQKRKTLSKIPIVIEVGGLNIRAGFAGYDAPNLILPSDYAYSIDKENQNKKTNLKQLEFIEKYLPEDGERQRLVVNGYVQDWELLLECFKNIATNYLNVEPENSPLFLVEQPFETKENRLKMVEMIFEDGGFHGIFMHKSPILASYVFAKENMLLLDSGADGTLCVPIIENQINQKGLMKTEVGGEYLTKKLFEVLNKRKAIQGYSQNFSKLKDSLKEWDEMQVTREIKHRVCKVYEFKSEKSQFIFQALNIDLVLNIKIEIFLRNYNEAVDNQVFELPDKSQIEISREAFDIPELMFSEIPEINFNGMHYLIKQSLEKVESEIRKELIQNIMVVGGNSLITSFIDRLPKELYEIDLFGYQNKSKVYINQHKRERIYQSWLGASIVGCMAQFEHMYMTKNDYDEHGSILIERKLIA